MKVLACAYACNPNLGSEEGVGWGWVNAIARNHDVWVLTDEVHRNDIDKYITENPGSNRNIQFRYIERKRWLSIERAWPPAYLATYRIWQRIALEVAKDLHRRINFDLVHVITFVSFRVPGAFHELGIPLVWGPVGGLENTPWRFLPTLGFYGATYYGCRNVLNTLHKQFLPAPKLAFHAARGGVIAATSSIQREIRRWYRLDSTVICEIGRPPLTVKRRCAKRSPGEPLRIAWSGLHLPGKALPLLLKALSMLKGRVDWMLDILGGGPLTARWRRQAKEMGLKAQCVWHGQVSRSEALSRMSNAHLFVITSVKDLTSTVLIEAMALGLPTICPDHCGFSDAVDQSAGLKLPLRTPRQFIASLSAAIELLFVNEGLRLQLSKGALVRSESFSWDAKASRIEDVYKRKLSAGPASKHETPKSSTEFRWNQSAY